MALPFYRIMSTIRCAKYTYKDSYNKYNKRFDYEVSREQEQDSE